MFIPVACSWGEFWKVDTTGRAAAKPSILNWPDTGQTNCYNFSTGVTCTGTGGSFPQQDADLANIPAARNYDGPNFSTGFPADYTTRDLTTGLAWKTCAEGKSGSTCSTGANLALNWADAQTQCTGLNSANSGSGYAGYRNWRLPTMAELETIIDLGASSPAITLAAFPGTDIGAYWSVTTVPVATTNAWRVDFNEGSSNQAGKNLTGAVRCVAADTPDNQPVFTDFGDGTVRDFRTNLVWAKCSRGFTYSAGTCTGSGLVADWSVSLNYCNSLALAGRAWRLPSVNEMLSISDKSLSGIVISPAVFPNAVAAIHWTSTTTGSNPVSAFGFDLSDGMVAANGKTSTYEARCVSGP